MPDEPAKVEGSERPEQGAAMELATFFHAELKEMEERIGDRMNQVMNLYAGTVKRMNDMEESFKTLKADLERTRAERADKEFKEAEARYKIALEHKDGLTTSEKLEINKVMEDKLSALDRARLEKRKAFWDKVVPGVVTALIISVVAPVGLAIFIVILKFILQALGVQIQLPT